MACRSSFMASEYSFFLAAFQPASFLAFQNASCPWMAKGQEIIPVNATNQTALWIFIGMAFLEALIWQFLSAIFQLSIKPRT